MVHYYKKQNKNIFECYGIVYANIGFFFFNKLIDVFLLMSAYVNYNICGSIQQSAMYANYPKDYTFFQICVKKNRCLVSCANEIDIFCMCSTLSTCVQLFRRTVFPFIVYNKIDIQENN